jgi:tryptophanyl-tRNA synthetase
MKQEVVLSGIKATGDMHIGNYFGAIKQWVDAQDEYEKVYIFIPDYHSIISVQDKDKLEDLIFSTAVNHCIPILMHKQTTCPFQLL